MALAVALSATTLAGCDLVVGVVTTPTPRLFEPPLETESAIVTDVVDGDTIRVDIIGGREDVLVRYIGIDAPEEGTEPLAEGSTAANEDWVGGSEVFLESDQSDTDQFGRLLRHVWIPEDGGWLNVNAELVRLGLADARTYPPDTEWDLYYSAAEHQAREAGLGIWGLPAP